MTNRRQETQWVCTRHPVCACLNVNAGRLADLFCKCWPTSNLERHPLCSRCKAPLIQINSETGDEVEDD